MLVVAFIFETLYPAFGDSFSGNSADPDNGRRIGLWEAKQAGKLYGAHAIWAWCLVALIDWPKVRRNTAPGPTPTDA